MSNFMFFMPEVFFMLMTFMVLLLGSFYVYVLKSSGLKVVPPLLLYTGVLYIVLVVMCSQMTNEYCLFSFHVSIDGFSVSFVGVCCVLYLMALWMLSNIFSFSKHTYMEPYVLLSIFFFGSVIVMLATDFFFLFLALEVVTIVSYILACLKKYSTLGTEAALKYFVLGSMSSGFFLFGIVLLYGFTGLTNFVDFKFVFVHGTSFEGEGISVVFGMLFLMAGLFFKLAVAPFHTWMADVFEGIPSPVVFTFSTMSKAAIIIVFCKVIWGVFFEMFTFIQGVFFLLGIISVVLGSVGGLVQANVQSLYAYSAMVNAGYFIVLLGLGSLDGFAFLINYVVIYMMSSMGLFWLLMSFRIVNDLNDKEFSFLSEFKFVGKINPVAAFVAALVFFSLAGMPPLAGFIGKFFFLFAIFVHESFSFPFTVVLVFSVVSTVYYMRCVQMFFLEDAEESVKTESSESEKAGSFKKLLNCFSMMSVMGAVFLIIFLFLLFFSVYQPSVLTWMQAFLSGLFF